MYFCMLVYSALVCIVLLYMYGCLLCECKIPVHIISLNIADENAAPKVNIF